MSVGVMHSQEGVSYNNAPLAVHAALVSRAARFSLRVKTPPPHRCPIAPRLFWCFRSPTRARTPTNASKKMAKALCTSAVLLLLLIAPHASAAVSLGGRARHARGGGGGGGTAALPLRLVADARAGWGLKLQRKESTTIITTTLPKFACLTHNTQHSSSLLRRPPHAVDGAKRPEHRVARPPAQRPDPVVVVVVAAGRRC